MGRGRKGRHSCVGREASKAGVCRARQGGRRVGQEGSEAVCEAGLDRAR